MLETLPEVVQLHLEALLNVTQVGVLLTNLLECLFLDPIHILRGLVLELIELLFSLFRLHICSLNIQIGLAQLDLILLFLLPELVIELANLAL